MTLEFLKSAPHRRYNPLTGEWVLVSPHRLQRPWQGKIEVVAPDDRPAYDPSCYLCPGNKRAGELQNPDYTGTFVFENDFAALLPQAPTAEVFRSGVLLAEPETGTCRVVCFSPRHDLTLPQMEHEQIVRVIDVWTSQYEELAARPDIGYVQIFENKGALMGCSNPHPHGQIWATRNIPVEPARERTNLQRNYDASGGKCLLCEYVETESVAGERIVSSNDSWICVVPFWAKWPFEALLISRRHVAHLGVLTVEEKADLARVLKDLLVRYDNVFETSFPYSMGFHQAPSNDEIQPTDHLHAHFYPPLLRSATVQKFMVGFEMLGTPQRDFPPEMAAARLREVSGSHYRLNT